MATAQGDGTAEKLGEQIAEGESALMVVEPFQQVGNAHGTVGLGQGKQQQDQQQAAPQRKGELLPERQRLETLTDPCRQQPTLGQFDGQPKQQNDKTGGQTGKNTEQDQLGQSIKVGQALPKVFKQKHSGQSQVVADGHGTAG